MEHAVNQPTIAQGPTASIPIALIREAIEGLGIDDFLNIVSIVILPTKVHVQRTDSGEEYSIDRRGVVCPQCHQDIGRPHTEYCSLQLGEIWDGVMPKASPFGHGETYMVTEDGLVPIQPTTGRAENAEYPGQPGERLRTPAEWAKLEDCRILDADGWRSPHAKDFNEPITQGEYETRRASSTCEFAVTSFVDNGCRCPNPERHATGCPALPHAFVETADYDATNTAAGPNEPYCWTCGAKQDDPRHDVLEGDFGPHLRGDCPNRGICQLHAIT